MHTCIYGAGCVRMAIVVMPDKSFVLSYKCDYNWAAKTHILLSSPDSLPTRYSHNTQITVLSVQTLWETCNFALVHSRVALSDSLQPCRFHRLWEKQELCLRLCPALFVKDVDGRCRVLLCNGPLSHIQRVPTYDLWGRECSRWGGGLWVQRRDGQSW